MILLCAGVLFACVVANRISGKYGMPALVLFMAIGMLSGSDGLMKIYFDDFLVTEQICNVALIFIMFYGGFGTNWKSAKPTARESVLLSTLGVFITAMLTGGFCYYCLKFQLLESFLIGAVISSTDAASVFSILRSRRLSLKDGTAPLLEVESGSNDPASYMLTMIAITMMQGGISGQGIAYMVFAQVVYGCCMGTALAALGLFGLKKFKIITEGAETIFIMALVLTSYGLTQRIGGNGFLSVYITGIILGNSDIRNKIVLVHFFDGITGLSQIAIFFLLGLLSFPHMLPDIIIPAVAIFIFLTFVARPVAVFLLMKPMKAPLNQCLLISWAGLRGAASIVFAIMAIAKGVDVNYDLFHIVFMVALLSVTFQGSMLPLIAVKLNMIDEESNVLKTFNDYQEKSSITMMRVFIPEGHNWENKTIEEAAIPEDALVLMIRRDDETIVPRGDTVIRKDDAVILSIPEYDSSEDIQLQEISINRGHSWSEQAIESLGLPSNILITLIKRGDRNIIPRGRTVVHEGDVVVVYNEKNQI